MPAAKETRGFDDNYYSKLKDGGVEYRTNEV